MPVISRRELLCSGLALSASSLVAQSAWGRTAALLSGYPGAASAEALAAVAPREQLLFDFGWKFMFGNGTDPSKDLGFGYGQGDFAKTGEFDFAKAHFDDSKWRTLNLPHDWAVELPFVRTTRSRSISRAIKPLGRRYPRDQCRLVSPRIRHPRHRRGPPHSVEFDGAFRDVLVFVNGCFIGRNNNGYAPFRFDITDFLAYGCKELHRCSASMQVSATAGSTRAPASIAMCGSPRPMRSTWASGRARALCAKSAMLGRAYSLHGRCE